MANARRTLEIEQFFKAFDAFGDHRHPQRGAERLDGAQHDLAARPLVNFRDEGAVDLQFVGGDVGERGQGGIAGAEIVDRHAHADLAQHRHDLRLEAVFRQESVFRHLDDETLGAAALLEQIGDGPHEVEVGGLPGGDVDADRRLGPESFGDRVDGVRRLLHDQMGDIVHQAQFGGQRE